MSYCMKESIYVGTVCMPHRVYTPCIDVMYCCRCHMYHRLCFGHTGELSCARMAEPIQMPFGADSWVPGTMMGVQIPQGKGNFLVRDVYRPVVTYLRMSAFRIVHLPDECIHYREGGQD